MTAIAPAPTPLLSLHQLSLYNTGRMSPEQVIADPNLDTRSDLYALGSVLYFCLAATNPYQGQFQDVLLFGGQALELRLDHPA